MEDLGKKQKLQSIRELIKGDNAIQAFELLASLCRPDEKFSMQYATMRLFLSIPRQELSLKPIKIAILASSTVQPFTDIFTFWMALNGFDAQLYISDFNTIDQTVLDSSSELYKFAPDIFWLFTSYRDVEREILPGSSEQDCFHAIQNAIERFTNRWTAIRSNSDSYIIQNNADLPQQRVFGNFDGNICWGSVNFLRIFNIELSKAASAGVSIFDLDYLSSCFGKRYWFDDRYWYYSKHAISMDALGMVSFKAARLIRSIKGMAKKCLVIDLDNTLWGGVIGDDGLEGIQLGSGATGEAFTAFQEYLKHLKDRGIILAVCSKNEEETAKIPFLEHPDMRLKLEDIAVFVANWNNKPDNIRYIADILNIGLDSMVFIDDNPIERELMRKSLPMVSVVDLPKDPTHYIQALDEQSYFETISFSDEDRIRGKMYLENVERNIEQSKAVNIEEFLKNLEMEVAVGEFDSFHLPRVEQIINKSNQFHLTTTRYTETQLQNMGKNSEYVCRFFKMKDRFGDNGLISVIILKKEKQRFVIDTWVTSCRVLMRGLEEFIHNEMVSLAQEYEIREIHGIYIPSKKNGIVANLYSRLGYQLVNDEDGVTRWEFQINQPKKNIFKKTYIKRVDLY